MDFFNLKGLPNSMLYSLKTDDDVDPDFQQRIIEELESRNLSAEEMKQLEKEQKKLDYENSPLTTLEKGFSMLFPFIMDLLKLRKKDSPYYLTVGYISWSILEKIETNKYNLEGVFIAEDYLRIYPYKEVFSHLLGYISKPNQKELSLPFISKMPDLDIGKEGLEKSFNPLLVGKAGQREIEVNSKGRIIREISKVDSIQGKELYLSVDSRIQEYSVNLLKSYKAGSINVINIKNGEISGIFDDSV